MEVGVGGNQTTVDVGVSVGAGGVSVGYANGVGAGRQAVSVDSKGSIESRPNFANVLGDSPIIYASFPFIVP